MSPDDIRFLYDYNAWANRRSLDSATALTVTIYQAARLQLFLGA